MLSELSAAVVDVSVGISPEFVRMSLLGFLGKARDLAGKFKDNGGILSGWLTQVAVVVAAVEENMSLLGFLVFFLRYDLLESVVCCLVCCSVHGRDKE